MGDVETKIKSVLVTVLGGDLTVDDVSSDADLVDDYGVDSPQMIAFLLGIEDAFDLELDYETLRLEDLRSVRQFAVFVSASAAVTP